MRLEHGEWQKSVLRLRSVWRSLYFLHRCVGLFDERRRLSSVWYFFAIGTLRPKSQVLKETGAQLKQQRRTYPYNRNV